MTDHATPNTTPYSIDQNPLLTLSPQGLPRFDVIEPAHINPAIAHLIAQADAALTRVTAPDFPSDWNQLALHLDVAVERLGMAWGAVST